MTTETQQPAVGAQVERGVRPALDEALRLAHAYADAKLMRYGMLNIENPPDPQAAFEALEAALDAVVSAERERCIESCLCVYMVDPQPTEGNIAYSQAVSDCIAAILRA